MTFYWFHRRRPPRLFPLSPLASEIRKERHTEKKEKLDGFCSHEIKFPFHNHHPIRFSNLRNSRVKPTFTLVKKCSVWNSFFFRSKHYKLLIWQVLLLVERWYLRIFTPFRTCCFVLAQLYFFFVGIPHDLALSRFSKHSSFPAHTQWVSFIVKLKIVFSSCKWSPISLLQAPHNGSMRLARLTLSASSHHQTHRDEGKFHI